eukprot:CAMPEP_0201552754 /NCGR_PEP_ID=MMETSP0173_2-20130828/17539_1 /ASSEMBLY_ACC=CAM_ASM_000268 /TAXON_ID=218659 /ORGANISM="Vexillifera sp., Strain DIVA3 564/2" /LENGTH=310 /DNA_ID=CAMNT_0047963297 /DNA_START=1 /DNA_END=933 /DNA_ORIENTATION=-
MVREFDQKSEETLPLYQPSAPPVEEDINFGGEKKQPQGYYYPPPNDNDYAAINSVDQDKYTIETYGDNNLLPPNQYYHGGSVEVTVEEHHHYHWYTIGKTAMNRLISKVLACVTFQMIICISMGAGFYYSDSATEWVQDNEWMLWVSWLIAIVALIALFFVRKIRIVNIVTLTIFTLGMSYGVAVVVTFYDVAVVLEAVVITASVVFVLMFYALFAPVNLNVLFMIILVICNVMFWWFLFFFIWAPYGFWAQFYALLGIFLYCALLIWDLAKLRSGLYPEEEWLLAAVNVWLDIINIFLLILALLGGNRR